MIRFNHKITTYKLSADGTSITASFAHEIIVTGFLLIAADGAWSSIRQQYLPAFNPVDTEGRFLYGKTSITPELRQKFNTATM